MAAARAVEVSGPNKGVSLNTKNVKHLIISTDTNRNRISFDLWEQTFRAAVGAYYSRMLKEVPPPLGEYQKLFPQHSETEVAAAFAEDSPTG